MGVGSAEVLAEVLGDLWVVGPARLHGELGVGGLLKWLPNERDCSGSRICAEWAIQVADHFHYVVGWLGLGWLGE